MKSLHLLLVAFVSVGLLAGCGAKSAPKDGSGADGANADANGTGLGRLGAGESDLAGNKGSRRYNSAGAYDANGTGRNNGVLTQEPIHRIYFELNSESISDDANRILSDNALWVQQKQPREIIIEGHCDERGTREYNLALGQKRADVVKQFLGTQGVEWSKIRTVSLGKEKPLVQGHDDFSWSQNRRAEIVLR